MDKDSEILVCLTRIDGKLDKICATREEHETRVSKLEYRLNGNGSLGIDAWITILKYGGGIVALVVLGQIAPALLKHILPLI